MGRGDTKGWAWAIQEPRSENQTEAQEKGEPGTGGWRWGSGRREQEMTDKESTGLLKIKRCTFRYKF